MINYFLALTILLAPTYAVRFNFFGLPTNLLMLWVVLVWIIFAVYLTRQKQWGIFFGHSLRLDLRILSFTSIFFLAGIISLFWQGFNLEKLGQFIVLFLQPISIFLIAGFEYRRNPASKTLLLNSCFLLLALMGIYSLIQYFTLWGLPPAYWGNSVEPKRALAFFAHPNFYSLFSAPLLAFLLADLGLKIKDLRKNWPFIASWIIGLAGLGLSLSRAGWLGLGVAGLVYLFFAADKKIRKLSAVIFIIIFIIILAVPNLRWRFALPFYGEKSAVSRVSLWGTGWQGIKGSPIFGLGLTGFARNWEKLNTDPNLDTHNYPHNVFLNFWAETGLLGLIGFLAIVELLIYRGLKNRNSPYELAVALFLIALLLQGLLDNPYFKNDLALLFWIILSLSTYDNSNQKTK